MEKFLLRIPLECPLNFRIRAVYFPEFLRLGPAFPAGCINARRRQQRLHEAPGLLQVPGLGHNPGMGGDPIVLQSRSPPNIALNLPVIARVLDHPDSRTACQKLGLPPEVVITGKSPFSVDENQSTIRNFRIGPGDQGQRKDGRRGGNAGGGPDGRMPGNGRVQTIIDNKGTIANLRCWIFFWTDSDFFLDRSGFLWERKS